MDFYTENPDLLNNESGTNGVPLHIGWCQSGNGLGWKHFSKIQSMFYAGYCVRKGKKFCTMRCKDYRDGCHWNGRMKPLVSEGHPDYYNRENWIMLPTTGIHTCQGIPESQITKLQFRNFVKDKLRDGISTYKEIETLSGLKANFAEERAKLVGDARTWRRCITESKIKKDGGGGDITNDLKKIGVFDHTTRKTKKVQFYHEVDGREYFFIPSLLHLMAGNISGDGTFHAVKNVPNTRQIYCINVQLYSDDRRQTHCHPILTVLLKDGTEQTYTQMWSDIKVLFRNYVGYDLCPTVVHSDNEVPFIKATKLAFPATRIVTCFFHIKENVKKHVEKTGLHGNHFVEKQKNIIFGLFFCDLSDDRQLSMAHDILQLSKFEAQSSLMGADLTKYVNFIDNYLLKVWFNRNSVYFAGKYSNFFVDIETEPTPQLTNNPSESLNKNLKGFYNMGFISKTNMARGILKFFEEKHYQLRTFQSDEKKRYRNPKDLAKFAKMKKLTGLLSTAMLDEGVDEEFRKQIFYEVVFKFGNIMDTDVNQLYTWTFPHYLSVIQL